MRNNPRLPHSTTRGKLMVRQPSDRVFRLHLALRARNAKARITDLEENLSNLLSARDALEAAIFNATRSLVIAKGLAKNIGKQN